MKEEKAMQTVISASTMTECDRAECAKTPSRELMRRAGEAIYSIIKDLKEPFAFVCGTGNNAGDGYVIASLLARQGKKCKIILVKDSFSPDGQYYFDICRAQNIPYALFSLQTDLGSYSTIVDCIYGVGFHGEPSNEISTVIDKINSSGAYVVSVDINSALDPDSGLAKNCVCSDLTVAVAFYKFGHFLGMAKDVMKKKACVDIGIPLLEDKAFARLVKAEDFSSIIFPRKNFCNKGDFGTVTILGGCPMYQGAVKLANMGCAALRSGCGIARVACPASLEGAILPHLLESTFYPLKETDGYAVFDKPSLDFLLTHSAAIAVGMGWGEGEDNIKILEYLLLNSKIPLIIDADGINALSHTDLTILKSASCPVILTPHPKEFSRLRKKSVPEILSSPAECALEFAREYNVILLLKGTSTIITDGHFTYICDRGCAGMATAGSGDVLTGVIAGLLGYNKPSSLAVSCGAYIAGSAGMLAQAEFNCISALSSDTVKKIPEAVLEILKLTEE